MNVSYNVSSYLKSGAAKTEEEMFRLKAIDVESWHEMYKGSVAEEIVSDFVAKVKDLMPRSREVVMNMVNAEISVYNHKEIDKNERIKNR